MENEKRGKLETLLEDYLKRVQEQLKSVDLPEEEVTQLRGRKYITISRPSLKSVLAARDYYADLPERDNILEFLREEYGFDPPPQYFENILIDTFGKSGEDLTDEFNTRKIANRVIADVHDLSKFEVRIVYQGAYLTEDFDVEDEFKFRTISENQVIGDTYYAGDSIDPIGKHETINWDFLAIIQQNQTGPLPNFEPQIAEFYGVVISLVSRSWVAPRKIYTKPISYRGGESIFPAFRDPATPSMFQLEPNQSTKLADLRKLLFDFFESSDKQLQSPASTQHHFKTPVNTAIAHYGFSMTELSLTRQSVTSAIIGLESLYKQYTSSPTSTQDVSRYCAMLLSSQSDEFEPLEIEESINEGYEMRNQWVHGQGEQHTQTPLQIDLWDYLRFSIVTFAWIHKNTTLLNSDLTLSDALTDLPTREDLLSELEEFTLSDYVDIDPPSPPKS